MDYRFSRNVERLQSSAVRDILKLTQGKEMISFAGGLPAEELFPLEAIREAADRVFTTGNGSLQYGLTEGYLPLREQICKRMLQKGMNIQPEQMIITTGSQQAIDLIARVLLEPGDVVLVENPTYLASLQVFNLSGLRVIPVASDKDGMIMEDLQRLMKQHQPRLVYVVPTFGNPTGRVWSLERRLGLLEICHQHGVAILEDDPYGDIKFDATAIYPTLYSLEGNSEGGCVLYTSTFSKTVAPALRTGWAMGNQKVIQMMAKAKQAADLHSSSLDQQTLSHLLEHFALDAHIRTIADAYGERMQHMQALLCQQNLRDVTWVEPKGGMFLWVELPEGLDAEALLRCAVTKNVAFVPGAAFYAEEPQRNTARLNFTYTQGERMALGIKGFAEALNEFLARC
ncbi:2-aminoadipate aminotransferase [Paenibacillus baekrokdamisoli]|uniref:2-aminoadipate aminotransferase n=1 Tax=Paenibacillus baekrokdamisoli TaxID=1712516 RepID=A0A3G9IRV5_9BACL|nr:PLP-dependent aminotransferase family protein [Paenibacillus baekrokdamisoli]MBB3071171.1 2-aminoadipate transaminase [Paenibacillus baekrokdamisoli]BBH21590.1 2-aminoadipate aminotransferase [Paenibacillus baekrokdamisoli]